MLWDPQDYEAGRIVRRPYVLSYYYIIMSKIESNYVARVRVKIEY